MNLVEAGQVPKNNQWEASMTLLIVPDWLFQYTDEKAGGSILTGRQKQRQREEMTEFKHDDNITLQASIFVLCVVIQNSY